MYEGNDLVSYPVGAGYEPASVDKAGFRLVNSAGGSIFFKMY